MINQQEKEDELKTLELQASRLKQEIFLEKQREEMRTKQDFIKKTGIKFSRSSDYIRLEAGQFEFYYGYEHTLCPIHGKADYEKRCKDENDFDVDCPKQEWAFIVKYRGKEIKRLRASELQPHESQFDDLDGKLVTGIALFITGAKFQME